VHKQTSYKTALNWANDQSKRDSCSPDRIPNRTHAAVSGTALDAKERGRYCDPAQVVPSVTRLLPDVVRHPA